MAIPAYLINLDRSADRLERMQRRLSQLDVAYERIQAIDGKALQAEEIDAVRILVPGWLEISASEVGCFLSHRKCWEMIGHGQDQYGCVLEDDVLLSPRLRTFLSSTDWIAAGADIVKLEKAGNKLWLDRKVGHLAEGFKLGRLRSTHYWAGGYIVSRDAARRLLALTERFCVPVDAALFDPTFGIAGKMAIYQILPALCVQTNQWYPDISVDYDKTTIEGRGRYVRKGRVAKLGRKARGTVRDLTHRLHWRHRVVVEFDSTPVN